MKNLYIKTAGIIGTILLASPVMAEEAVAAASKMGTDRGMIALASGIAIAVGAIGGTLGQGRAVAAALEGVARNPAAQGKILIPMILGLAFIESLVVLSFLIAKALSDLV